MTDEKQLKEAKDQLNKSKILLFDFDGTLCNLDALHMEIFAKIFKEYFDLDFSRKDFMTYISGRGSNNGIEEYLKHNGKSEFDIGELGKLFTYEKEKALNTNIKDNVYLLPGIDDFLSYIHRSGKTSIVVTSSKEMYVEKILSFFGIYKYISKVFDGNSVQAGKPAPDIFLNAIEYSGIDAEHCMAFEDSKFGLQSATTAGLFTVGILNKGWNDEFVYNMADIVIEDYRELI